MNKNHYLFYLEIMFQAQSRIYQLKKILTLQENKLIEKKKHSAPFYLEMFFVQPRVLDQTKKGLVNILGKYINMSRKVKEKSFYSYHLDSRNNVLCITLNPRSIKKDLVNIIGKYINIRRKVKKKIFSCHLDSRKNVFCITQNPRSTQKDLVNIIGKYINIKSRNIKGNIILLILSISSCRILSLPLLRPNHRAVKFFAFRNRSFSKGI